MGRTREPSTWAGLAALVALFAPELADVVPELAEQVLAVAGGLAALVAIIRRERASPGDSDDA